MSFLLEWVFSESAKRKTNKYVESSAMRGRFVMPYVGVTIGWSIYWNEFFYCRFQCTPLQMEDCSICKELSRSIYV